MKLAGEELSPLYAKARGFQWVKYFTDAKTLTVGSVTAWDSAADVEAFIQSENYQAFLVKLKPSMKGPLASNVYEVQAPPTN
jgi:heme-degrading monooxygenase HmoA